jgi:hypothetical protein
VVIEGALLGVEAGSGGALVKLETGGVCIVAPATLGKPDAELDLAVGKRLRVRGLIEREAPQLKLTHWAQVEMA